MLTSRNQDNSLIEPDLEIVLVPDLCHPNLSMAAVESGGYILYRTNIKNFASERSRAQSRMFAKEHIRNRHRVLKLFARGLTTMPEIWARRN